ncbi:MAG: biopolymer transporter ExbD [Bacteroidota bacterium]
MAAHKPKRGAPTVDMTAMVDVAFLLLTFFILTTTSFRQEQKVEVDMPSSRSQIDVPVEKLMTISVDPEGKVFVGFSDISTRVATLEKAISDEQLAVSEVGAQYFSTLEDFGVPINQMEAWLNLPDEELKAMDHPGMTAKTDSVTGRNDLKEWIRWGRLSDREMRIAIKGDVDAQYEKISDVMNSLQEWKINSFSLITSLEEGDEEEEE